LLEPFPDGRSCLEHLLGVLGDGQLVILGSGDSTLEAFIAATMEHNDRLLFLNGFSESLAALLYAAGDLFLMPSSFEPCGISQMLALRAGQPCLVHGVGGLNDTIEHGRTGFVFQGSTPTQQAVQLVSTLRRALELRRREPGAWRAMRQRARRRRFSWSSVVKQYEKNLYELQ